MLTLMIPNLKNSNFIIIIFSLFLVSCKDKVITLHPKEEGIRFFDIESLVLKVTQNPKNGVIYKKYYTPDSLLIKSVTFTDQEKIIDTLFTYNTKMKLISLTVRTYTAADEFDDNDNGYVDFYFLNKRGYAEFYFLNEDGTINRRGNILNNKRIGWWKFYKNGKPDHLKYINTKDTTDLSMSQYIKLTESGQINEDASDYFRFIIPDTLYTGKSTGTLLIKKRLAEGTDTNICISHDLSPDYSNINNVQVDTFYSNTNNGFFGLTFKEAGNHTIRGFVYEIDMKKENDTTLIIKQAERTFEKKFFVIQRPDSINPEKVMRYDVQK